MVEESRGFLEDIVGEYVDILIANEDEALAYTGYADEVRAVVHPRIIGPTSDPAKRRRVQLPAAGDAATTPAAFLE